MYRSSSGVTSHRASTLSARTDRGIERVFRQRIVSFLPRQLKLNLAPRANCAEGVGLGEGGRRGNIGTDIRGNLFNQIVRLGCIAVFLCFFLFFFVFFFQLK